MEMMEAYCRRAVCEKLRGQYDPKVEFDVKLEQDWKECARTELRDVYDKAIQQTFNIIAEVVLMKCPRCMTPFVTTMAATHSGAANWIVEQHFCAVCLKDCGTDAHAHASQAHGNSFDKKPFEESRVRREQAIIDHAFFQLSKELFEFKRSRTTLKRLDWEYRKQINMITQ
jgi:uncharacterized C2H2 Zn-finger protein